MQFKNAQAVEQVVWQMRLANYPRELNQARINELANGAPPYSDDDVLRNMIEVNVNDLSLTRLAHDARAQLAQAFNKPGNFFKASTDAGAANKRRERSVVATSEATRLMKRDDPYFESLRSKMALVVLHGVGPSNWENCDLWRPIPLGVEDIFIPGNTNIDLRNLPFFAIYRPYTAHELRRLTRNREAAAQSGWNLDAVDAAVRWADDQTSKLFAGTTQSQYWSPAKQEERFKQDSGIYASDLVQTIDCLDFYYLDDANRHEGWRRRIIFDAYSGYSGWRGNDSYGKQAYDPKTKKMDYSKIPSKNLIEQNPSQFLFSSGNRVFADRISQIVHFQFGDLSAVAPFKYHSVRSLGWLVYAACHLQNRLRCAFSEAVFENLMMYLRVQSEDELAKALRVKLANRGIIDPTVQFVPPGERWQPNYQLAQLGLNEFKQIIADNSASYTQNQNFSRDRVEKTKFQVMAEVSAMQSMVSAALQQAYRYQATEYREIFRRLMRKNSSDPDANEFQARCMKRGIPEKYLTPNAWDIEPERVIGGGNRTMEMAIAQQLWEMRTAFAPEAQQEILRDVVLAVTEDAAKAKSLVPDSPGVSDDRHDAMVSFGSLMAGAKVGLTRSQNRIEVVQTWLAELGLQVQALSESGAVASQDKIVGFENTITHISQLIAEIGTDPGQKEVAKELADMSGGLARMVKGFAQQLMEQMEAQNQGGDDKQAETMAKVQARMIESQAKAANARESHAQRTAQKQLSFELEEKRKQEEHQLELQRELDRQRVENATAGMATAAEIQRKDAQAASEPAKPDSSKSA